VWNRKRSTALVGLEIFICFLVLAGISAAGTHFLVRWQRPLGFEYDNVWAVEIGGMNYTEDPDVMKAKGATMQALLHAVTAMPETEAAAIATNEPYNNNTWISTTWIHGKSERLLQSYASVGQKDVFKIHIRQGRWLEESDVAYAYTPVVISQNVAEGLFGAEDPIGKDLPHFDEHGKEVSPADVKPGRNATIYRIVGVSDNVNRYGELGEEAYTQFIPVNFATSQELPNEMMIRVRPGTNVAFEERLLHELQTIAPQWTYETEYMLDRRKSKLLLDAAPLLVLAAVGLSLIVMVGLGLVGVLWLNVTRRTSELGLRRAMGASALSVRRQVIGELWALSALAVLAGTLIFLQLPLFGVTFGAPWYVFLSGVGLATAVIFTFVTVCGLYPAWLATRIQPALALQYE
jgi:putative ABC transport system permease protein